MCEDSILGSQLSPSWSIDSMQSQWKFHQVFCKNEMKYSKESLWCPDYGDKVLLPTKRKQGFLEK